MVIRFIWLAKKGRIKMLTKWRRWARPKNYNAGSVPQAFVIVSGVLLFPVIVFLLLHFCRCILFDCTRTDLWMWSCQMGSANIRLSFVLYNMAVKNTNQRLSLTLITQSFVFVSIDFVFVSTVFYLYQLYLYLYKLYFLLYKLSVKNTNERLFLALITRPPSFIWNWDTH